MKSLALLSLAVKQICKSVSVSCFTSQTCCWSFAAGFIMRSCMFAVCAFPYILAFTTDSIEIRLVVNGNLVYTAVVPELQLAASRVSMTANTMSMPSFCQQIHCNFVNYLFYLYFMSKTSENLVEMQYLCTSISLGFTIARALIACECFQC